MSQSELEYIIEDSHASHLVCLDDFSTKSQLNIISQRQLENFQNTFDKTLQNKGNDPAFILYTSGSSNGKAKGVIHSHRSINAHEQRTREWLNLRAKDLTWNTSALNWSFALHCNFLDAWQQGISTFVYDGKIDSKKIIYFLNKYPINTLISVPGIYRRLIQKEKLPDLKYLKTAVSAGETLPTSFKQEFEEIFKIPLLQGLGMSENSVYITERYNQKTKPGTSLGTSLSSCGLAYFPEMIRIQNQELLIHQDHPGLMLGYLNQAKNSHLKNNYFHTGDLVTQDEKGFIFYQGRKDSIFNSGGYKISPLEIEEAIYSSNLVSEVLIKAYEPELGKTLIAAHLVKKPNLSEQDCEEQIKIYLNKKLSQFKQVHAYFFHESLPKTSNGKVRRNQT